MLKLFNIATIVLFIIGLVGCVGKSPGQLEGVWQAKGLIPMQITFRPGETESMGMIEHVSYSVDGNSVTMTYIDGPMKGTATRFTLVDANTATNTMFTLKRIR